MLEATFQSRLIEILSAHGALAKNLHGNQFQSGMPDLFIINKSGRMLLVELKVWRRKNPPEIIADLLNLTGPIQRNVLIKSWVLGNKNLFIAATNLDTSKIYFTNCTSMYRTMTASEFVTYLLESKSE